VGADDAPRAASRKRDAVATRSFAERDEADGEPPEDDEDEDDEDESMFKGRVAALASRAGAAVQEGGRGVAALGARATQGIFSLFRSGQRRGSGAKERVQRRTTAARASIP